MHWMCVVTGPCLKDVYVNEEVCGILVGRGDGGGGICAMLYKVFIYAPEHDSMKCDI